MLDTLTMIFLVCLALAAGAFGVYRTIDEDKAGGSEAVDRHTTEVRIEENAQEVLNHLEGCQHIELRCEASCK